MATVPDSTHTRWTALAALPGLVLLLDLVRLAWGYSKDDSWISFRYGRNWVMGEGLVFNPGERIEGYTNPLWTLLMAPFAAVTDPMPWAAGFGVLATIVALVCVVDATRRLGGSMWAAAAAGALYAVWPPVALWAVAGLEQGLVQALAAGGGAAAIRAGQARDPRWGAAAGALFAGAAMTRPDGHAVAVVGLLTLLLVSRRPGAWGIGVAGGLLAAFHGARFAYYGSLVPNTFLVKGGSGLQYWEWGVGYLRDALVFGDLGVWLVVGAAGLLLWARRPDPARAALVAVAAVVGIFAAYLVKVGVDELIWFRLFLPAWPGAAVAAALGLERLVARAGRAAPAVGLAVVAAWAVRTELTSRGELVGFSDYNDDSRRFHADIGKYLTRHAAAGSEVAFQDMGSTPFHAPDLVFVDTIGLVDRTIARLYSDHRVNPFLKDYWRQRPDGREHLRGLYRAGREYLIERDPDWVVYVAFPPEEVRDELKAALRAAPDTNPVDPYLKDLTFYFGWAGDPRFRDRYRYVRTWRRSSKYWITLWRRADHAAVAPPEVVYPAAPTGRPHVQLADGTAFAGGTLPDRAFVADELFVETWWLPAGPVPASTLVEIQLREGPRAAFTEAHVPGDWLWPGDRWAAGQAIRDRVLLPLPRDLRAGRYTVWARLRDRAAEVVAAPGVRDGFLPVGAFDLVERPWWDFTRITPTDPTVQRAEVGPGAPRPPDVTGPTLVVGGDVNLGRRQNAITASEGPAAALGALPWLREADLAYANLECVVADGGAHGVDKGERGPYYYRGRPELLAVLEAAGIDVVGTANNHTGDYGPDAVVEQEALLDRLGLAAPGSGTDRAAACAPVFRRVGDLTAAFVTVDATKAQFAATDDRPGVCHVPTSDLAAWSDFLRAAHDDARARAHLVFLGVHWGDNGAEAPTPELRAAGRAAVDAGFDGVLGSSAHVLHGVEVHRGRPIVYDAGNLLFDASGDEAPSALFEWVLTPGGVAQVRVHPIVTGYGSSRPAGPRAAEILSTFARRSRALGTDVYVDGDVGSIGLPTPPVRPGPPDAAPSDPPRWAAPGPTPVPPPGCVADVVPADATGVAAVFGDLELLGARVTPGEVVGRGLVHVESWWRVRAPTGGLLDTRVVPVGHDGPTWSGAHDGCDWSWPIDRWVPGAIYRDHYAIRPPQRLPPGAYEVRVGRTDDPRGAADDPRSIGSVSVRPAP
jgi:poly-gamma-glutamate capsule biosynthesis protein CapA/YwtB (metallophosphatase superfamily)